MTVTLCSDCDHVHADTRKMHPRAWVCIKFPRVVGQGFVADAVWVEHEPYMRCSGINGGKCPVWKSKRTNQTEIEV